jgi:hypothetical protein
MAIKMSSRNGIVPIWIVIHTAEGSRTVESLYNFFNGGVAASSHAGADGFKLSSPWVPDELAAWTLLNGNPYSFNLELCGFARWTRAQWLSEGCVDGVWNPRQMIRHAALWVVEKKFAAKRIWGVDIPLVKLSPAQVGRKEKGVCGHVDYTFGTGDGDHTDPGVNFPWDVLLDDANKFLNGTGEEDDMTPDEYNREVLWRRYGEENRNLVDMEREQTNRAVGIDNKLAQLVELAQETNTLLQQLLQPNQE